MRLWGALYALTWVVFIEFLLALKPEPGPLLSYAHLALGFVIVGIVWYNARELRASRVPGRVKRIAAATLQISIFVAVLGLLLWFSIGSGWDLFAGISVFDLLLFLHVVGSLAVITQAAATAIAFDMWEEKEFLRETSPGEVPAPSLPVPPAAGGEG